MEQMTLFENNRSMTPLASRVRPDSLEEFVGQEHLNNPCQYYCGQDSV